MKQINIVLGERIRNARSALNITREKMAELVDVSPRFLADVEAGKVGVSIETLKKIGEVLEISADYLLDIKNGHDIIADKLYYALTNLNSKYYCLILAMIDQLSKIDGKENESNCGDDPSVH